MNLKHTIIKDITEQDFRDLNLIGYVHENDKDNHRIHYVAHYLNDVLDSNIEYMLKAGYSSDQKHLAMPVYIAIHKDNYGDADGDIHGYFDPMMNRYHPNRTYQIGFGIRHLYSTRDYYEDHDDYWRVSKKETDIIYRIHLSGKWLLKFVLKRKTITIAWPYHHYPDNNDNYNYYFDAKLEISYVLDEETGEFKETSRCAVFKSEHHMAIIHVDKDGYRIKN